MTAKVISFHYKLTNKEGEVLDSSEGREPLAFLTGAQNIIPGLEKQLVEMEIGAKAVCEVPAAEAYGETNAELVGEVERSRFPENVEVGMQFATDPSGMSAVKVIAVTDDMVTIDGNHPLAGVDLTFDVEITEVRVATEQELSHGHVHQGGHDH